jgi:nucleoside-diphosphate-sugar epimerase
MPGRIFIAGAGGAVGRPLCRLLIEDGWQVWGTTRSAERASALRALDVEPVLVDVFDAKRLLDVVIAVHPDVVIHQLTDLPPGLDPSKMQEAAARNARIRDEGTRNLVAAAVAAGAGRLIAQSIAFAYAPGPQPHLEDAPLNVDAPGRPGTSARAARSLEQQVLAAPLHGIVLRYGRFHGPGTGFEDAPEGGPVHVEAAADAARRAVTRGTQGIYNIAEQDGTVSSNKAATELGWSAAFRIEG